MSSLLLESGDYLLLEDGSSHLLLEGGEPADGPATWSNFRGLLALTDNVDPGEPADGPATWSNFRGLLALTDNVEPGEPADGPATWSNFRGLLALTLNTDPGTVIDTTPSERPPVAPDHGGAGSVSGRKKKSVGQRVGPALSALYEPPKPPRDELEEAYQHAIERAAEAEQVSPELAHDFYGNAEAIKELMAAKPDGAQAKAAMAAELARIQQQIRDDEEALTVVLLLA